MIADEALPRKSRLAALLDHFAEVEDPRDVRRILHPLPEVLLLVVCGTIADCDDYEDIAAWDAAHLDFLRRHLPYENGAPGERWLTTLMNRINPALFAAAFAGRVRESWPDKAGSSPSTARPRVAATTAAPGPRRCTSSPPSPLPRASCSPRRPSPTRPTNSPPSRRSLNGSAPKRA